MSSSIRSFNPISPDANKISKILTKKSKNQTLFEKLGKKLIDRRPFYK
jgi:hypothetical protein